MVTPAGSIAETLDGFRQYLAASAQWQTWAGASYADRIHLSENRTQIENEGQLYYINQELAMPFSIIWLQGFGINPNLCTTESQVLMMFQDKATDRQDHNESANAFVTNAGLVIDQIADGIKKASGVSPSVSAITMPGQPARVSLGDNPSPDHDYWTMTFQFETP